jgi:hypothetical protein
MLMPSAGATEGVGAAAGVICAAPAGDDNCRRGKNWTTQEQLSLIDSNVKLRGEHRSWRGCELRRIPRRKQSRAAVRRVPSLSWRRGR